MDRTEQSKIVKGAYEKVFSSDEGETVLFDLIQSTGFMGPSLDYNTPDPLTMAFNDGAKSIVARIIQTVKMEPKKFLKLVEDKTAEHNEVFDV